MIRLLMAGLLLCASGFGWASAYPDKYEGVPNTFKDGDIIKAEDFNNNNLSIKKAINDIPAGATGPAGPAGPAGATGAAGAAGVAASLSCTTDQIIKWGGSAWVCADMPSGGGGSVGKFLWRDANGNLFAAFSNYVVLYRFPESDKPFEIWDYNDNAYRGEPLYFNTTDCSGAAFITQGNFNRSLLVGARTSTHWLLPDLNAPETASTFTANTSARLRNGVCEIITNDVSVSVFSTIQSSAPVDIIAPPIELIWE
jgi:hypothetical protein